MENTTLLDLDKVIPAEFRGVAPTVVMWTEHDGWAATWDRGSKSFELHNLPQDQALHLIHLPHSKPEAPAG